MKTGVLTTICVILVTFSTQRVTFAADADIAVLDEKVNKLTAQLEDLQFRYQQLQKDMDKVQTQLQELRRAAGGTSPSDLHALEDKLEAETAARLKDRQIIIDQLSKQLAAIKGGKPASDTTAQANDDSKEHVVVKGENLTGIAKAAGVTVAALRKANNLASNDIKVGQKLVIPPAGSN